MTTAGAHTSDADWACRVAERLPAGDVHQLAQAAAGGTASVHALRAQTAAPVLRSTCDQILARLDDGGPGYIAGLLAGAARAVERARRYQSVRVVWTGPESGIWTSRLTAATVIDLIAAARHELLLVSFATQTEPGISAALDAASARGVAITLLTERHADNHSYAHATTPFPDLDATRLRWPSSERPPGAALHAKIIVVDDTIALVGSANLTSRAMEDNLECGILIRGGPPPSAIRDHIMSLYVHGCLQKI
jgi:phosphatidylserine/phosphatidylglycerophosphate/cardiolipin synthase-like enzyme